jgi:FtsH-binding integral membrane protein
MFETAVTPSYRSVEQINSAMLRVYNHMAMAVATSAIVAGLVASSAAAMAFFFTGWMQWVTLLLPIPAIMLITVALNAEPPKSIAVAMLHGFAALMGLSMGAIVHVYTAGSLVMAFASTVVLFGTMSLYGYFTKQSLQHLGQYLLVGLIAIVIASVINLFVGSSVATMVISALAIVIFLGLTAYDTQNIREMVSLDNATGTQEITGALSLYLNFVNIFVSLLQLFGNKND